ncbi:DOMON domain-containing protein [Ditylenchus destructor]|uniref:DOMON domain-containing protein n=1 Tax=Ditylenchus destructor TaxID=166010 RepID=A0AAD4N8X9_9BILA|nr:DOMON domain-containing protein [Ditylenchus destructor]
MTQMGTKYIFALLLAQVLSIVWCVEFINTDPCGDSVACWSFPPKCEPRECEGIIRWRLIGEKLSLEMQATDFSTSTDAGRYLALGFSSDTAMGNDSVVECVFDVGGKSGEAYISYNENTNNYQLLDASQKMLSNKTFLQKDGKMICSVDIDYHPLNSVDSTEQQTIHKVPNESWNLLFAQGLTNPETGEKYIHAVYPWKTEELVEICEECPHKFIVVEHMRQ